MEEIFVSIIVSVYNVEKYVEKCINSILAQTYKNFELIIIIDGSKDKSEEIVRRITENYENVKIISRENRGLLASRLEGVKEYAKGEYVTFIDSDDWIANDMLEKLVKNIKQDRNIDIVRANSYVAYLSGKNEERKYIEKNKIIDKSGFDDLIYKQFVESYNLNNIFAQLIKKDLFDNIDIDETICLGEDLVTNTFLYQKSNKIKFITDFLYYYRYNPSSITNSIKKEKLEKNLRDSKKTYSYLKEYIIKNSNENNKIRAYIKLLQEINHNMIKYLYIKEIQKKNLKKVYKDEFSSDEILEIRKNIKLNDIIKSKCRYKCLCIMLYKNWFKLYLFITWKFYRKLTIIKQISMNRK